MCKGLSDESPAGPFHRWIAAAIDGFWGSLVSIAVCVLLSVLMQRTKATAYDQISALAVAACSIALLVGVFTAWFQNRYPRHIARG